MAIYEKLQGALPCPFCASDDIKIIEVAQNAWKIKCLTCNACKEVITRHPKEQLLAEWNSRRSKP